MEAASNKVLLEQNRILNMAHPLAKNQSSDRRLNMPRTTMIVTATIKYHAFLTVK
jgi:hypothetical protein